MKLKRKVTKAVASKVEAVAKEARPTEEVISELNVLRAQKKTIEAREKELRAQLGEVAESNGMKDNNGGYKFVVGDQLIHRQAKKSIKLNHNRAEDLFRSIELWNEVIDVKEVINEDYIEQVYLNGKITEDQLQEIMDVKITNAVVVRDYKPEEDEM